MGGVHPTVWLRISLVGWALPTRGFGFVGFGGVFWWAVPTLRFGSSQNIAVFGVVFCTIVSPTTAAIYFKMLYSQAQYTALYNKKIKKSFFNPAIRCNSYEYE